MARGKRENTGTDVPRGDNGKWLPGTSPNPGGRPKKLQAIERMLDEEHRTVENMRDVYRQLKSLAVDGVEQTVYWQGTPCGVRVVYNAAFMELYLNRVQGPVEQLKINLQDAPDEIVNWIAENLKN